MDINPLFDVSARISGLSFYFVDGVHLHNGILFSSKKEENFTLCDSMDGPGEHYAKWNKPVSNISSCWKIQAIYQSTKRENALWISLPRYSI